MKMVELKKKVPKFLILPLAILLVLSIYSGFSKYKEKTALEGVTKYLHFTKIASDLIHELQKERGLSSGYLASKGKSFSGELKQQRALTDEKIKLLDRYVHSAEYEKEPEKLLEQLREIDILRRSVDEFLTSDAIDSYTNDIDTLLQHIRKLVGLTDNGEFAVLAESYLTLIEIKEKAGSERALINKVFGQGNLSSSELYKFGVLVSAQEIYLKHFKHIAKQEYVDMLTTKDANNTFSEVEKDRNIIYAKSKKNNILLDIKETIGYGGLIHNFKNYVLHQKEEYAINVKNNYSELLVAINEYKSFEGITKEELDQLNILQSVFASYMQGIEKVKTSYQKGAGINALNSIVKVNDNDAKAALYNLKTNIYGSQMSWFQHTTNKINLLKNIEDKIAVDLVAFTKARKLELFLQLVVQIVILMVILVIIMSSIVVLKQLMESGKMLNMAQENTKSGSFEYYMDENIIFWSDEHYKLLQVDKNTFNPTLESFMNFVHPDDIQIFKDNLALSISSKKVIFFEYRILLPDRTLMYVRSSAEVIRYSSAGSPLVMIGTITDISESKRLEQEIIDTQKDVIFTMGAIGENRSKETGEHVKRVAEYSKLLYLLVGADQDEAELLKMASPMHDIGKIGIPDSILNKPGKLSPSEWTTMQTHSEVGYNLLKKSDRKILNVAATIALTHHERYDGTGYPRGLMGEEIPLVGRITAVADVFDALGSDRCYKDAWDLEKILEYIKSEREKQFDPKLVDIFVNNMDKFLEIRDLYKD